MVFCSITEKDTAQINRAANMLLISPINDLPSVVFPVECDHHSVNNTSVGNRTCSSLQSRTVYITVKY